MKLSQVIMHNIAFLKKSVVVFLTIVTLIPINKRININRIDTEVPTSNQ